MIRPNFDGVPEELRDVNQWILWKMVSRDGKEVKLPWSVYDKPASSTDPQTWSSFECVVMRYDERRHAGIGFVFAVGDGYAGVDLDACRNPDTGEIASWAQGWIDRSNSYTEISPSGTGVKIWLRSDWNLPKGRNIKIDEQPMVQGGKKPGIEIYTQGRYFAVTGHVLRRFTA